MATEQRVMKPTVVPSKVGVAVPDRLTLLAFALMVLAGGGSAVAMRFTYVEMPPFWSGTARFTVGALVFWGLTFLRKIEIPKGKVLMGTILFGALSVGGAFILVSWGLEKTPASLASVLMALVPLLTLFFAYFHGLEPLSKRGLVGSFLAVAGIAVALGGSAGTDLLLPRVLAIIGAAGFMAESGVVAKSLPRTHPIATSAVAMTVGAIMLSTVSLLTGEQWVIPTQVQTWIAFGYLILIVNLVTFLLYLYILRRWTASGTSYGFVLIPLVTVVVAANLAGEQITWNFVIGGVLVLAGVFFGALLSPKSHESKPEAERKEVKEIVLPTPTCG
jgi:drug/metabolite transporter (DMT)-like permease